MSSNTLQWILSVTASLILGLSAISCAPGGSSLSSPSTSPEAPQDEDSQDNSEEAYKFHPLLWESALSEGKNWSKYVFQLIHEQTPGLLQGADDVETFCPRYYKLDTNQRVNFWGLLVSAMTKYECGYDPLSRMRETTMGTDPITKKQVFSEGLLQLSYQDTLNYSFCDFDWSKDKNLSATDPRKTILDPYRNLNCGIKILDSQVRRKGRITLNSGVYWAVIRLDGKNTKVPQIAALTRKMPGCM